MRHPVRLLVAAIALATVTVVPAGGAGDRMWVGFHDDPVMRYDAGRDGEMDNAAANGASVLRTIVTWASVAPTKPANARNPFDSAYRLDDVDEFVRAAQARGMEVLITLWGTPRWANGGKGLNVLPRNMKDFQNFAYAVASRYSGRTQGLPFVRFYGIWNESNLNLFLTPQFDKRGRIVSARNYAKLAAAGIAGIKSASPKSLVAIGETSSTGRDKRKPGQQDTVAPGTFARLVAQANPRLKFDAWGQHPYPFPVSQKPTQRVRWPNVSLTSLPRLGTSLDQWFKRKGIPIWVTEYGHETKPGEPKGVTEGQQAVYIRQAFTLVRQNPRVQMFIWFVLRDSTGSPWQSGLYRTNGSAKPGRPVFAAQAGPVDARNGKVSVKAGTRNPAVTVYLRSMCANNPIGSTVGVTQRTSLGGQLVAVSQSSHPLGRDCTITVPLTGLTVAKGKSYVARVDTNTINTPSLVRTITIVGT